MFAFTRCRHFVRNSRRQRGFSTALLLILLMLGLTMWGLSELLQESVDKKAEIVKQQDIHRLDAKRALLDYAMLSPPRFRDYSRPGEYDAYRESNVFTPFPGNRVPFRRFYLPCPDSDGDGVSDVLTLTACSDGSQVSGFLPWRQFDGERSGDYEFVRGLGEGDFNEDYRQAHRYTF